MLKIEDRDIGLLENVLEAGLKARFGLDIAVNINVPKEPEYVYVTDGINRLLKPGEWYQGINGTWFEFKSEAGWRDICYTRIEKSKLKDMVK